MSFYRGNNKHNHSFWHIFGNYFGRFGVFFLGFIYIPFLISMAMYLSFFNDLFFNYEFFSLGDLYMNLFTPAVVLEFIIYYLLFILIKRILAQKLNAFFHILCSMFFFIVFAGIFTIKIVTKDQKRSIYYLSLKKNLKLCCCCIDFELVNSFTTLSDVSKNKEILNSENKEQNWIKKISDICADLEEETSKYKAMLNNIYRFD
jgi:signal transduction histidine kinase